MLEQSASVLLQVIDVSGELSLEGVDVSLDGIDQVAEVSLEGVSESGYDLQTSQGNYP